ncbi:serine-threonine/tyrosine-protein kinase catalytic domain-containing protein [Tanacetum coccineum]
MSILKESKHLRISLNEIELATNNFTDKPIGKGGYGMVYRAELCISGRPTTVAVKTLGEKSWQGLKQFLTEIQLLTGQNHKNVISLLGYCEEPKHKSLVYEYAAHGSLDAYIDVGSEISLTWKKRLEICLDAARGLNHLHSNSRKKQTIIHRDIKSANILLDDKWVAKIADLGLSKLYSETSEENGIVSDACGTPGYCDPKYYDGILKKEYDVYSFGIVLFEVLCGRVCNVQYKGDGFVLSGSSVKKHYKENNMKEIIDPRLREQMSLYSINKFSEVAYQCLLEDEGQRPSMNRVVKELEELLFILEIDLTSSKDVGNPTSNSYPDDPISKVRYEKVRRLFERFDVNRDGVLNKEELAYFFIVTTPQVRFSEYAIFNYIDRVLRSYGESINGEIGLTCDGMLRGYGHGVDILNTHFEMLRLTFSNEVTLETTERYEKVKRIFQRFDLNKDGYLEMCQLERILMINSPNQENELLTYRVKNIFHLYSGFIEGDKGLNCDGLFKLYGSGIDCLDDDFEKLNLTLNLLNENEIALRYEKVRRMFQRFDINEDGGLNREELTEFFFTTYENKISKEVASLIADYTFSAFKEFTDAEKGLTCDGLLHNYEYGADTLDDDFKKLRLDLKPLDDWEEALRAEKVRMMFERHDMNKDGGLDKWELSMLLSSTQQAREEVGSYVDKVFRLYAKYIDGDKGLTCDGLFRTYDHGINSLDVDFERLGLQLRTSTETQDASRKKDRFEKVRKIFKRFDFDGDGVLDRKELFSLLVATSPKSQRSEEQMTVLIDFILHTFGKFVDGVIGLTCDGLMKGYDHGEDDLEDDFEKLRLR